MKSIEDQIHEIQRDLTELNISYYIWRSFTDPNNKERYQFTIYKYSTFFRSLIDAQYMSVIVVLNRLLENKQNTINLHGLKSQVSSAIEIKHEALDEIENLSSNLKDSFEKLVILRSNVFAHRSKKVDVSDLYNRAGISPNFLRSTIDTAEKLFNTLIFLYQNRAYRFDLIDFIETDELMSALANNDQ